MTLTKELRIAEELARKAGTIALGLQDKAKVSYKPMGEGPVTEADIAADDIIREGLQKSFPEDTIITEESFKPNEEIPGKGRVWFVDPIDGTSDYVKGGDDYSVMIGLCIDGKPTVGVVYQPAVQTLWRAIFAPVENVCERVDASGQVTSLNIADKGLGASGPVAAISRNHGSRFVDFVTQELGSSKVIRKGSVGLKIALIADGIADFYFAGTTRIKLWDTCAPTAIILAAGGVIRSIDGAPLIFDAAIKHGIPFYAATPKCEAAVKVPLKVALAKWHQNK